MPIYHIFLLVIYTLKDLFIKIQNKYAAIFNQWSFVYVAINNLNKLNQYACKNYIFIKFPSEQNYSKRVHGESYPHVNRRKRDI